MSRSELLELLKYCLGVVVVVHLSEDCSFTTKISKAAARKMIGELSDDEEVTAMFLRNRRLLILG